MAPFRRGKAQAARKYGAQARGGKFAGRGGRTTTRKPVSLSRVEEQPAPLQGDSTDDSLSEQDLASEVVSSSDSDDEKESSRPYNSLLHSLSTNIQRGQPQRKKRKLGERRVEEGAPAYDDVQDVLETEDLMTAHAEADADVLDEEAEDVEGTPNCSVDFSVG